MTTDTELLAPTDLLGRYLAETLEDQRWLGLRVSLVAGGKSNLTFELSSAAGSLILRRPPSGQLLPTAHDMGREARVQRALAGSRVPVPEILAMDESGAVLDVPFYVMRKVAGHVVRGQLPAGYADSAADRRGIADALIDVLAELHQVDANSIGLADFGRPDGFLGRQLRRWQQQWQASRNVAVAAVDALGRELAAQLPDSPSPAVVHGDFRLDNCLLDERDPARIAAVLDWEMSTLGDPLTDVGLLLFYWAEGGVGGSMLTPGVTGLPGFPGREHLIERYSYATGRDLSGIRFYEAFAHFKFAVIAQGVAARVRAGAMAGQDFGDLHGDVVRIAESGLSTLAGQ